MHIFKMNEFFRGISLPQPETIEPLEKKISKQALSVPNLLDFLKVNIYLQSLHFNIKFILLVIDLSNLFD